MAAGIEGGSWEAVEEKWDPAMHAKMHAHWKQYGPPVYMSVAAYLGYGKKTKQDDPRGIGKFADRAGIIH